MPPFPWLQGGSCFHNVLVSPASISKFYKITNLPICLDVSHSFMASSFLKFDFIEFVRDVLPYTAHLHLSDASSFNREGLQIGDGLVPLSQLFTLLSMITYSKLFYVYYSEIWQGHVNNGHGFQEFMERLSLYL